MLKPQENVNDKKNKVRELKLHQSPKYTLKIMKHKLIKMIKIVRK